MFSGHSKMTSAGERVCGYVKLLTQRDNRGRRVSANSDESARKKYLKFLDYSIRHCVKKKPCSTKLLVGISFAASSSLSRYLKMSIMSSPESSILLQKL